MKRLLIFGLGYSASHIAAAAKAQGWHVDATGQAGNLRFDDDAAAVEAIGKATHILSSVPPESKSGADPVLARYGGAFGTQQLLYLSSTGVYGDTRGAWVDESAPTGTGRRLERARCDAQWLARGSINFRLPGIYGPGRNPLERVRAGKARRIDVSRDMPGQVFSRIHVEDIASAVLCALELSARDHVAPNGANDMKRANDLEGAYNIADNYPASQNAVVEEAARLLGQEPPALVPLEQAGLSDAARGFYSENRRVANGKAKRVLGWTPRYPTYREGLRHLI